MGNLKTMNEFLEDFTQEDFASILEMATIKKDNLWGKYHFRVVIHGPTENSLDTPKDRPTPHIHIHFTDDAYPYRKFNFEVSLVDIFCKNEYNLILQEDHVTISKFSGKRLGNECSWDGYSYVLKGLKDLLEKPSNVEKNGTICLDNLQLCIETYNDESNSMSANPFIDYVLEHSKECLVLESFKNNLEKYYPDIYTHLKQEKII